MPDLTSYQKILETKLATITTELEAIAHRTPASDDWEAVPEKVEFGDSDPDLEADVAEEWNERRATVASLETEYRDLKRALAKITAGTFGLCEISGLPIEADRLSIKPTARTCKAHLGEEVNLPL